MERISGIGFNGVLVRKDDTMDFDDEELQSLHDELKQIWETRLKEMGVKWPRNRPKMLELLCLFSHLGEPVYQDEISKWIQNKGGDYKFQARDLPRDYCWDIVSGNPRSSSHRKGLSKDQLMMVSTDKPNPNCGKIKKSSNIDHIKIYYSRLRDLRLRLEFTSEERCENWIDLFEKTGLDIDSFQWNPIHTSVLLALVHPDEFHDQRGEDISIHFETPHSKKSFTKRAVMDEDCQIGELINGVKCPYVDNKGVQMDHLWPHSLGGPTHNSNMVYLCQTCNQQKSSSPLYFDFDTCPSWLVNRIKTMFAHKKRIWN